MVSSFDSPSKSLQRAAEGSDDAMNDAAFISFDLSHSEVFDLRIGSGVVEVGIWKASAIVSSEMEGPPNLNDLKSILGGFDCQIFYV